MTGNTCRFRYLTTVVPEDQQQSSRTTGQEDNDIFLYNDHNEKGGRNGIACMALSIGMLHNVSQDLVIYCSVGSCMWKFFHPKAIFPTPGGNY